MSIDKVQVLKRESAAGGGKDADDVPYPTPLEPMQDAMEARGYYIQSGTTVDTTVLISRAGSDMTFKDNVVTGEKTLSQLLSADGHAALTNNPHGVTAAQAGALPTTGGNLTGNLSFSSAVDIEYNAVLGSLDFNFL